MIGVDTNLLFAWLNQNHPGHSSARVWIRSQAENPDLALSELALMELYGLLRNPVLLEAPLTADAAVATIEHLRRHPHWELFDYPGGLMDRVWLHAAAPGFARRRIYDARLALSLRHHGVTEFATVNVKDFAGFGFTRVWNPLANT